MLQQRCLLRVVVHIFVASVFLHLFLDVKAHLNHHLQSGTSAIAASSSHPNIYDDDDSSSGGSSSYIQPQETWQPISSHNNNNNWIILHTSALTTDGNDDAGVGFSAADTAITKSRESPQSVQQHTFTSYMMPVGTARRPHTHAQQEHQQQMGQHTKTQRLPVKYYAYNQNHSTGNYQPPSAPPPSSTMKITKDVKSVEPYVLAISKLPSPPHNVAVAARAKLPAGVGRQHSTAMNMLTRRKIPVPLVVSGSKLPQDIISKSAINTKSQSQDVGQDINSSDGNGSDVNNHYNSSSVSSVAHMERNNDVAASDGADKDGDNINAAVTDDIQFNEMLLPLESALDKVIHFCDFAKRIISEEDEKEIEEENEIIPTTGPRPDIGPRPGASGDDGSSTTGEVKGRNNAPTSLMAKSSSSFYDDYSSYSYTDFDLSPFGRGHKVKKYKRKLKKFLLPLLIAYKLKFLTLVPLLIGGLTLLVGATGMAGFFFALFAVVMSLKPSIGGKSIIVKRI